MLILRILPNWENKGKRASVSKWSNHCCYNEYYLIHNEPQRATEPSLVEPARTNLVRWKAQSTLVNKTQDDKLIWN